MILDQPHELTWGGLVLDSPADPDTPYLIETLVGTSFGNPVTLTEVVRSQFTDGDLAVRVGWGNREDFPVLLRVSATDGQALFQAEAALFTEVRAEQHNPLVWTSPALGAWPHAFDVAMATLEREWDTSAGGSWDHRERYSQTRLYRVLFNTLPFTRDLEPTVIPALDVPPDPDVPPVVEVINDCTSTTGWVRRHSPVSGGIGAWYGLTGPTISGGGVRVTGNLRPGSGYGWLSLELTDTVDMTGTPYLTIDVEESFTGAAPNQVSVRFDSGTPDDLIAEPVAMLPTSTAGVIRYYFEAPASFDTILLRLRILRSATAERQGSLKARNVSRTDRVQISGSNGFQVARTAIIEGTAPTGAAVRLDAGENPLVGSVAMIYTGKSPVVPLRALRISSASVTVDPTKISGGTNDLSTDMVIRIPVARVSESIYTVLALLSFTGNKIIEWSARMVAADGSDIPGSDLVVNGSTLVRNPSTDPWRIHALAALQLPIIAVEGETTHAIELTLSMTSGGNTVTIDEGWLADTAKNRGAVTLVHEPSEHQLTAIEIRSAQLDAPRPAVIGTWAEHGVQDISRLALPGTHQFDPGLLHIFTATDIAKNAPCELRYYRRYFLHAGPALPSPEDSA